MYEKTLSVPVLRRFINMLASLNGNTKIDHTEEIQLTYGFEHEDRVMMSRLSNNSEYMLKF